MIELIHTSSKLNTPFNPRTHPMIYKITIPFLSLCLASFFLDLGAADKKVVFVAGAKSHGYFSHEHTAGSKLLAKYLDEAKIGLKSIVVTGQWLPQRPLRL